MSKKAVEADEVCKCGRPPSSLPSIFNGSYASHRMDTSPVRSPSTASSPNTTPAGRPGTSHSCIRRPSALSLRTYTHADRLSSSL